MQVNALPTDYAEALPRTRRGQGREGAPSLDEAGFRTLLADGPDALR